MPAKKPADFTPVDTMRHSAAHVLAAAVMEMFPDAKLGVGPVIDNGFFYDLDLPRQLTPLDLQKLEARMAKIVQRNQPFVREVMPIDDAIELFKTMKQDYKVELLTALKTKGTTAVSDEEAGDLDADHLDTASVYRTGKFLDLCRGPHVESSGKIGAFKLRSIAGAYWRGDQKNKQLQRVYGLAFPTKEDMANYLTMQEEAEKRDHRKLGKELELFTIINEVGLGLPLFYPKGALLRRLIEDYVITEQEKRGYVPIWIPHITRGELYKISGHLDKYDAMYTPMKVDEEDYYLKPMNCPHFMMLYRTLPHSYRELPLRYTCTTTNYRYEKHGELNGLTRVRSLTQDDCHVFCTAEQIEKEISLMLDMIGKTYKTFGFKEFWVRISLRDPKNKKGYLGDDKVWETSESALRKVVKKTGWNHKEAEGEAAFYGPKLDFMLKDAIGREWQLSTIQLDFNLPERFELEYVGDDGAKHRPVVIHRAILGSTERFLGIMIEHYAGAFPSWLAPVQVQIIPVGKDHWKTAKKLHGMLAAEGIRSAWDELRETVGYKIRKSEKLKIPYMLVIGDKEKALKTVNVRIRGVKTEKRMAIKAFVKMVKENVEKKKLKP
ncbi:MAG TPA: threonine--tRNA ligase [Candidatus Eisenbacteria bacterium]|nr:threonine--tRNA ligase [Candidatus Eisenbacteria bacterium]